MREESPVWGKEDRPLHGFVHAGGVLQDATIPNMSLARCRAVFAPKVTSICNMEVGLQMAPVSASVLFSSIASHLGGPGQANYTAANAALDATAVVHQAQGSPETSVQWGAWAGAGMASTDPGVKRRADMNGIGMVVPDAGLAVMATLISAMGAAGAPQQLLQVGVVTPFVWANALKAFPNPGIYNEFVTLQAEGSKKVAESKAGKQVKKKSSKKTATTALFLLLLFGMSTPGHSTHRMLNSRPHNPLQNVARLCPTTTTPPRARRNSTQASRKS